MEFLVACCLLVLFCTSCSLIGTVDVIALPDPFAQPPRGAVMRKTEPIVVEAIVNIDGKLGVVLACRDEHETVQEGEQFKGFTVAAIGEDSVTLIKGRKKRILHVN
ncbi:hypothetical protein FJ365_06125 [Candidatus Dependentiae bacterium]|nr:hypothetical protein [Candidatus Dependentiae bacterium]